MTVLTEEHINFIVRDIQYRGLVYEPLEGELIDHICIMVEDKMKTGLRFKEAYDQVISSFGDTEGIQKLQSQTILSTNNNTSIMIRNYLKIAFRNLTKHKFYSFINIMGLAVGIACCLLISLFVNDEVSYDQHHEQANRIYRVTSDIVFGGNELQMAVTPAPMAEALVNGFPEVEASTRFRRYGSYLVRRDNDDQNFKETNVVFADSSVFDVFTIPLIKGSAKEALNRPRTVIISEATARRYFKKEDPIGKILVFDSRQNFTVTGVFEDMPDNSHFHFDFMVSLVTSNESAQTVWLSNNFHTYVVLQEGATASTLDEKLAGLVDTHIAPQAMQILNITMDEFIASGNKVEYKAQALKDIHLKSDLGVELEANGDIRYVYLFSAVAFFILVIACINFMNLSTARSANRAKEVGVRKVLGSFRIHLIRQFLTESILLSVIAFLLAIGIAALALPYFNILSGKELTLPLTPTFLLASVAGAIVLGILAGVYPAFFLSAFKPVSVLKGKLTTGIKSGPVRSALVVFQFVISILLVIGTITVYRQLNFIQNKKLGFNKDQVIVLEDAYALGDQLESFKQEMINTSFIKNATISGFLPVSGYNRSDIAVWPKGQLNQESMVNIQAWSIDYDYLETMGMEIIAGRNFSEEYLSDSNAVIINQRAADLFGFENPVGEEMSTFQNSPDGSVFENDHEHRKIIGVVENFHFESLRENIDALYFYIGRSRGNISFQFASADASQVLDALESKWKEMAPGQPFQYSFLDDQFGSMYDSEQRTGTIFTVFATLAIFIACLGLFALAAFTAEQRTKEIGVRKIMGASVSSIVFLLSKEFGKLIVISIIIAAPLGWWAVKTWLEGYSYKVTIGAGTYLMAGLGAFLVAWITMSYQSIKAAISNPIDSLKAE
ncbi:MAG: ABC transporter permease [Bacteroidota bacterium]